jgi:hypothetical protein
MNYETIWYEDLRGNWILVYKYSIGTQEVRIARMRLKATEGNFMMYRDYSKRYREFRFNG